MKKTLLACILSLVCACLPAITLNDMVLGVTMHPDFAQSLFPVAIEAKFTMPGLEVIPGNGTSLSFIMNAGYTPRRLLQDPRTGDYLKWNADGTTTLSDGTKFTQDQAQYSALFSAWSLAYAQGFAYSPVTKGDLITARISFDGRWEQAMERLEASRHDSWASDNLLTFVGPTGTRPIFSGDLIGTPDLQGNRYMLSTSLNLSLTFNLMNETNTAVDGLEVSLSGLWAPWWLFNDFNIFGGKTDYWKLSASLSAGYTLYQLQQKNGWNWFSVVLTDDFSYRYLDGRKVPKFAETGGIWKVSAQNLTHTLTNSTKLYLYGPQFIAEDCYPYLYAFLELGYTGGYLNNTNHQFSYQNFMGSAGVHVHLRMFGIFHFFYETGYVFGPERNEVATAVWPGTVGFYISLGEL